MTATHEEQARTHPEPKGGGQPLKVDVGCGDARLPGYVPADRKLGIEADDLPYDDGSVDEIRASHVLEHFSHADTLRVLRHWHRKLRPGGTLKVAVPNFDWIIAAYQSDQASELPIEGYLMGGHVDSDDRHGAIFSPDKLERVLRMAGFASIRPWRSTDPDCSALPVSCNMEATKFAPKPERLSDVRAVMSMGRLCFSANMFCMHSSLHALSIPVVKSDGAFWGQCLTRLMELALEDKACKWVMAIDYDSIYTADDIIDLYTIAEREDADVVFPVQVGRDRDHALATIRGKDGKLVTGLTMADQMADSLPVDTGHFGLTLVSRRLLESMPRPWFLPVPDKDGRWNDGRVDDDIFFWKQAHTVGAKLLIAPHVKIGHLQQVITWPDGTWRARHQYYNDWASVATKPDYARW